MSTSWTLGELKSEQQTRCVYFANLVFVWCRWNSAVENQAIDRIHRFGQTREVGSPS
jgi:hypothetical protein